METALIAGSTGDIGEIITLKMLEDKYNVVGLSRNRSDKQKKFLVKGIDNDVYYKHFNLDVLSKPDRLRLFDNLVSINLNHVILIIGKHRLLPPLCVEDSDILLGLQENCIPNFILMQYCVNKWLSEDGHEDKSITFISSVATETAAPEEIPYHAAKSWMIQAIKSYCRAFSANGIRFNVISPGLTETNAATQLIELRPEVLSRIPLKKLVKKEQIADCVSFVVKNSSITGLNLHINNGRWVSM